MIKAYACLIFVSLGLMDRISLDLLWDVFGGSTWKYTPHCISRGADRRAIHCD